MILTTLKVTAMALAVTSIPTRSSKPFSAVEPEDSTLPQAVTAMDTEQGDMECQAALANFSNLVRIALTIESTAAATQSITFTVKYWFRISW